MSEPTITKYQITVAGQEVDIASWHDRANGSTNLILAVPGGQVHLVYDVDNVEPLSSLLENIDETFGAIMAKEIERLSQKLLNQSLN